MLIHLNGMPGVGKLTVAQILAARLPHAHLLDNHIAIDTVYAAGHPHGSDGYIKALFAINNIIFDGLSENKSFQYLILTNALAQDAEPDPKRFVDVENLAKRRSEPFVPVLLTCALQENQRRIVSPSRQGKRKLKRPEVLADLWKYHIIHPEDHPNALAIDTTSLEPEQTAQMILNHVQRILTPSPVAPNGAPPSPTPSCLPLKGGG